MKVDVKLDVTEPAAVSATARRAESEGYDGLTTSESSHDPFLPLALAGRDCDRLELRTAIAVAFARTPMSLAYVAHDLQAWTGGRFTLGIGSQVRQHVERRFGMPWSAPAARMREFILALRAIWDSWQTGAPLEFEGEYYQHTLMTPFFSPPPNPSGPPAVELAAVGEHMTRVAAEVADGLISHAFTTRRYLAERTWPAIEAGRAGSIDARPGFTVSLPCLVATGATPERMAEAVTAVRKQIAFYASTPAYRAVLDLHGWDDLGADLSLLARSGRADKWAAMGSLVPDEVLEEFAIVAPLDRVGADVVARFGGLVHRVSFYTPWHATPGELREMLAGVRAAGAAGLAEVGA